MPNKKKVKKKINKLNSKIIQKDVDETGVTVVAKLNALKFGLAFGIVFSILVAGTMFFVNAFLSAYHISNMQILIRTIYGFTSGFILGGLPAWVYNKLI